MPSFVSNPLNNYFEAILQIRPFNKEVLDYVVKQVEKNDQLLIAKIEELKEGVDFYMSSQRQTISLGKKLKRVFNGEIKITRKLHTLNKQTSKNVYRVTVLFRLKH